MRDLANMSSEESDEESVQAYSEQTKNSQTSRSTKSTKSRTMNNQVSRSKAYSMELVVPQEFKDLHRQTSYIEKQQEQMPNHESMMSLQPNDPLSGKLVKIDLIDDIEELR